MGAEGTGRAHTNWKKVLFSQIKLCHVERSVAQSKHPPEGYLVKQASKFINKCMGSCRGIANMGAADASRRFAC